MTLASSLHEFLAREQKKDINQQFKAWHRLNPAAGISRAHLTKACLGAILHVVGTVVPVLGLKQAYAALFSTSAPMHTIVLCRACHGLLTGCMAGAAGQTPDRLILYIESWQFMARAIKAPVAIDIYLELAQATLEYLLDWAEGQYPDVSAADGVRVVAAMAAAMGVW
jgi:hypothetical protein